MTTTHSRRRSPGILLLAAAFAVGATACGDATGPDDDDHGDPASVRLLLGGQEVASADQSTATGEIQVQPGEETGHITVQFLDDDGDVIDFDLDEFYLDVAVTDPTTAAFEQDSPGEFGGHVHGLTEGTTAMAFRLMHGTVGSGHADFESAGIDVRVEE